MAGVGGRNGMGGGTGGISALSNKAVSDQMESIKNQVAAAKEEVKQLARTHGADLERTRELVARAVSTLDNLEHKVVELEAWVQDLDANIGGILTRLETLEVGSSVTSASVGAGAGAGAGGSNHNVADKNSLHEGVRDCMRALMWITEANQLPAPLGERQYWSTVVENVAGDEQPIHQRMLRPDWDRPWAENESGWLLEVVDLIKDHGNQYTNIDIESVTHKELMNALNGWWRSMVKRWHKEKASTEVREEKAKVEKIKSRKRTKAKERRDIIIKGAVPELTLPCYKFLQYWQYQSTDESDTEDVAGPGVDPLSEEDVPVVRRKVWRARAPAYRVDTVNELLAKVDQQPQAKRNQGSKATRGNTHVPRVRGPPRADEESALPAVARSKAVLIPRNFVRAEWLETPTGKEFDTGVFIGSSVVVEGIQEGGDEERLGEENGGEEERPEDAEQGGNDNDQDLEYA
ncbi:hypothetical protein LXA43DRAFT_1093341 [Ganoderma leucocontextum]|nr:hypothetical protein LXA43DRAFT_1093341 [Ganoderma leucocontextum]